MAAALQAPPCCCFPNFLQLITSSLHAPGRNYRNIGFASPPSSYLNRQHCLTDSHCTDWAISALCRPRFPLCLHTSERRPKTFCMLVLREEKESCLTPFLSLTRSWHHKEDEKNGQQTSDLILEGGLHAPHPALSFGIYISSQIPLYTQLNKEFFSHRQ